MGKSIVIASGKGGVGKTFVAVNLALALAGIGKRTILVDADITMANVLIVMGIERAPINLQNVLSGDASVRDAMYEGPLKLKYVPSGLSHEKISREQNFERIKDAIKELETLSDFVIIDSPPGLGADAQAVLSSAKEVLLVLNPDPSSLAGAIKVKNFAVKKGCNATGIVINRVTGDKSEIKKGDLETILALKSIAEIAEDPEVRKASALQEPLVLKNPSSQAARAITKLAYTIAGEAFSEEPKVKKGFLQSLVDALTGRR
jgi:septum site-determining protein MinD